MCNIMCICVLEMATRVGMGICKKVSVLICYCMLIQVRTCYTSIKDYKCIIHNVKATVLATSFIVHSQYFIATRLTSSKWAQHEACRAACGVGMGASVSASMSNTYIYIYIYIYICFVYFEYGVRAPVFRKSTGANGRKRFSAKTHRKLVLFFRNLRKSRETSGSLRENVI